MKDERKLNDLFASQDENNIMIATEIMKARGENPFDIVRLKRSNDVSITDEEAIEAGVLSDCKRTLLKCVSCGGESFDTKVLDTMQGMVCEEMVICKKCENKTYWGYGHFDLNNMT